MKVGILTFPCSTSYGAVLQMYALYHTVGSLGHDARVINYHNAYMKADKHYITENQSSLKTLLKKKAKRFMHRRLYRVFADFEKNYMQHYPTKPTDSMGELYDIGLCFDAAICGSDQVWNPDITDSDMSYFLDFCTDKTRRISYAPSFGVVEFSDGFTNKIKRELEQFHAISVREEQGRQYLSDVIDKGVALVCDPTFLVPADHWAMLEHEHPLGKGDYIFYYTIRSSHTLMSHAIELSKKTGLKLIIVGGNSVQKQKNKNRMIDYAVDISPEEWLYLIHHAKYVVTNSFHGTAFSVNFRKDFYLECSSYTNSRLEHITKALGLCDRILSKDTEIEPSHVDYGRTDEVLPELIGESMGYLENSLS